MPQNPLYARVVRRVFRSLAAIGNVITGSGTLVTIIVVAPGTAGNLTLNDCTTTGAASGANQIDSIPFGSMTAGQVLSFWYPYSLGVTISAITTAGTFHVIIG